MIVDRKDFLASCASGLCAGATNLTTLDASTAEPAGTQDWQIRFVQRRYSKLLEIIHRRMGEQAFQETLRELGACCAGFADETTRKFRGDLDGFIQSIQESVSGDTVTYDRDQRVLTMASGERTACFCPFLGAKGTGLACHCSLGWQQHTWETFFQKKVRVELKEAFLRGGKRCVFEIHVSDEPVDGATAPATSAAD